MAIKSGHTQQTRTCRITSDENNYYKHNMSEKHLLITEQKTKREICKIMNRTSVNEDHLNSEEAKKFEQKQQSNQNEKLFI